MKQFPLTISLWYCRPLVLQPYVCVYVCVFKYICLVDIYRYTYVCRNEESSLVRNCDECPARRISDRPRYVGGARRLLTAGTAAAVMVLAAAAAAVAPCVWVSTACWHPWAVSTAPSTVSYRSGSRSSLEWRPERSQDCRTTRNLHHAHTSVSHSTLINQVRTIFIH